MRCDEARQLFDAYLNGELSSAMTTELHAHRVKCPGCRRELALLEVSGHVLRADGEPVALDVDFTDRLIACMDAPKAAWRPRLRWLAYVGGPLAAAAVVALAFLGLFDTGGSGQVAGVKTSVQDVLGQPPVPAVLVNEPKEAGDVRHAHPLEEWFSEIRSDAELKRGEGRDMQGTLDLTILQLLDILEDAKKSAPETQRTPAPEGLSTDPLPAPPQGAHEHVPGR